MFRRLLPVLAALTLAACEDPPAPTAGTPPSKKDANKGSDLSPEVPAKLAVAAPLLRQKQPAALTLAVHPARWSALHGAMMPWLAKLGSEADPFRAAKTPEALPALAAALVAMPTLELEGWDASRPILVALGETEEAGVAGATVGQLHLEDGWAPGIRHQISIPATDPAALLASVDGWLGKVGTPLPALSKGRKGAAALRVDEMSVVLLPERQAVRVVMFSPYTGLAEDKAIAHMSKRLDTPIHISGSAAAQMFKDDTAVFGAWLRPDRLRPLGMSEGSSQMFEALAHAAEGPKAKLLAAGTGILMSSDAVMIDQGAEVDEVAMTLVVDGPTLRLRQLVSLSDEGEAALTAATTDTAKTFESTVTPVWAELVVRANVRAFLDALEPPPFPDIEKDPNALLYAIQEGGYFATIHMGVRHGLGLLRLAEQSAGPFPIPTDVSPTAAHAVWSGMTSGDMPKVAVALHWPAGHDLGPVTSVLESLGKTPDLSSLKVSTTEFQGSPTHVVGVGGLSKAVFADDKASAAEPLLDLHVDVPALAAAAASVDPRLDLQLQGSSALHLTLRHHSKALVGELAWSPPGGEVEAKPVPVPTAAASAKPVGNPAVTEPQRCVGTAALAYASTLRALASATPESLGAIVTKGLGEADAAVKCAEAAPKSKLAVEGLRRVAISTLLQGLSDPKLRESVRAQQCPALKDAPFCAASKPAK